MNNIIKFFKIFVIISLSLSLIGCSEQIEWPDNKYTKLVNKPDSNSIEYISENDDFFSAWVNKYSEEKYNKYIESCKDRNFTKITKEEKNQYIAFNDDNYKLELRYSGDILYMDIYLPKVLKKIEWPTNTLTDLLPMPTLESGNIEINRSDLITAQIGNTTQKDYDNYVKACKNKGFTIEYNEQVESFVAYNINKYHLYLYYQKDGTNVMTISLYAPSKDASSNNTTNNNTTTNDNKDKPTSNTEHKKGIRKEFKEAMATYEEFFDEYVNFMIKYNKEDDPTKLLDDYNQYMKKYTETMNKMNKLKNDKLSVEELGYYTEVNLRIAEKLASVE